VTTLGGLIVSNVRYTGNMSISDCVMKELIAYET
jgi:hypothetical protein